MSAKLIRQYLRTQEDGATEQEIGEAIRRRPRDVKASLKVLRPCIQIDRWDEDEPVWMLIVPEDCPRPEPKRKATA